MGSHRCCIGFILAALPAWAGAEDLVQVYRDAKGYDAQYAGARYALAAGRERAPQGRAGLLPNLNLTASTTRTRTDSESDDPTLQPSFERRFRTDAYTLTLIQPIYRRQSTLQYDQALWQVKQSEALFAQAGQDLLLRVTQAYFDVLAAQDTLTLVGAQKAAISEQLAQAKRNFEVGTATITDTHEAQSRYDLVLAQEIAAQNDLDNKRRSLEQLTGKEYAGLKPLREKIELAAPNPNDMQAWVELSERQAYGVQIQQALLEVAQLEAKRGSAGHYPTLDLVATHGQSFLSSGSSALSSIGSDQTTSTLGLQLALPLYQGGGISSREREAAANLERSRQDLEQAKRAAVLAARQAYLASVNGLAQVKALEQALVSSQSALESNKLGYQVGVRINIDVLNAQQQLYSTQRDLALARYNTITSQLRLKAAAGSLQEDDLAQVNQALAP
jgi:outer membrane protein